MTQFDPQFHSQLDPRLDPQFHLAQVNTARLLAPADDPSIADFVAQLDRINALAEASPGFVWRYVSDTRDPQDREYPDPLMLFNLSVWQSAEHLYEYAYRSEHAKVFADRRKWFEKLAEPQLALWWIPAGHIPTVKEAKQRLATLTFEGPGPRAFTFRQRYDAQGQPVEGKKPGAGSASMPAPVVGGGATIAPAATDTATAPAAPVT